MTSPWIRCLLAVTLLATLLPGPARGELKLATFRIDATPPEGSPLCDALVVPAVAVDDPLSARGVVLLGAGDPIVLCAVDWVGIGNGGQTAWKESLARAAGTRPDRVCVHCLHQHDAPGCDFQADAILAQHGLPGAEFPVAYARQTIERAATAVREAIPLAQTVTHLGLGRGIVEQVASNRRILQADGKVHAMRASSCRDPALRAAPEGLIDPVCRAVSFHGGEQPLAVLTYYATHPQSYYGRGRISADFVGLARAQRERETPGLAHLHFNGCGGNVAAGKYNDGSPELRPILAQRLAKGMAAAWEDTQRVPLADLPIEWRTVPVQLPPRATLDAEALLARVADTKLTARDRVRAARDLAWLRRCQAGDSIDLAALRIGHCWLVHLPGETFIEYQIACQQARPDDFVAVAGYGDYGPGYIGTAVAYEQGGYETSPVSRVAPEVETHLLRGIRELLK